MSSRSSSGFAGLELLLVLVLVAVVGFTGYYVWHSQKETDKALSVANDTAQTAQSKRSATASTQKYLTVNDWKVRLPYSSSETLSVGAVSCDNASEDGVDVGCYTKVISQARAAKYKGTICEEQARSGQIGVLERETAAGNYSDHGGSENTLTYAKEHPGQYTKLGNYYYFFSPTSTVGGPTCGNDINARETTLETSFKQELLGLQNMLLKSIAHVESTN